ncbi:uncharacterized protein [Oscarella lobularis]|uniref:uncharacterized protein n=1 Tax=Oscarella lobularis TaxID=121494 RepID=UPI003313B847
MISAAILCLVFISSAHAGARHDICDDAEAACLANSTCNPLWKSWRSDCSAVIAGSSLSCSAQCNASFNALIAHDVGNELEKCQCDPANYTCQARRINFFAACRNVSPPPAAECPAAAEVDRPSTEFCSHVSTICFADATCGAKLSLYLASCGAAFANQACTVNCRDRILDIACDPIGRVLYAGRERCICNYADISCMAVTTYVNGLCFDTEYPDLPVAIENCGSVYQACQYDPFGVCQSLFGAYIQSCAREVAGPVQCSPACKNAADALFSNPVGWHMSKCSCGDDTNCAVGTAHLYRNCYKRISPVPQKCSEVLSLCSKDATCKDVGAKYEDACNPVSISSCVEPCKTAATKMLYDPIGSTLNYCYCDDEDATCLLYRSITLGCNVTTVVPPPTPTGKAAPLGIGSAIVSIVFLVIRSLF